MHQRKQLNKKAQEEMVGFVVIMLVVAVIFLIFLGIYLRQGPEEPSESTEISQFLDAILEVSTRCDDGYILKLSDIISECAKDESSLCTTDSTETNCEAAQNIIVEITETTWTFAPDSPKTGYRYAITRETNQSQYEIPIFDPGYFSKSTGEERSVGNEKILPGGIKIYLEIFTK